MTKETEAKWRSRVAEWKASGMTAEAFATGNGFKPSTLRFWSYQLGKERAMSQAAPAVEMARVVRIGAPAPDTELAIAVGDVRVLVGRGFDAELLRQVVRALDGEA